MKTLAMRKDQLQEAVRKTTKMLARKDIAVTQIGAAAYCKFDATGKVVSINLPMIPDNPTESFLAALQGYLDHEVAHSSYTDAVEGNKALKHSDSSGMNTANLMQLANIVEDTRIERLMAAEYRGTETNLEAVRKFIIDSDLVPSVQKARDTITDEAELNKQLLGIGFPFFIRGLAGQNVCKEFITDNGLAPLFDKVLARVPDLGARLAAVSSTEATFDIARDLYRAISGELPPPPPESPKPDDQENDGEGDDNQSQKPDDSKDDDSKDDDSKDDEKSQNKEDEGNTDEGDDADEGDGEGSDEDGEDDAEGMDDSSGDSSEEDGEEDGDGDDEGDSGDDEGSPDDSDSDGGDSDTDTDGDEDDQQGGGDSGSESESSDTDDGGEAGEGDGDITDDEGGPEEGVMVLVDDDRGPLDIDFDKVQDLDNMLATAIKNMMKGAFDGRHQVHLTRDRDEIEPYKAPAHYDVAPMENEVRQVASSIQKEIQRIMVAKSQSYFTPGFRSGRLNGPSLHRLSAGDDRVFRRRHIADTNKVAVSLVVDLSGSMHGNKVKTALQAAWAFAEVLDRLKIANEVCGFTTSTRGIDNTSAGQIEKELTDFCSTTGLSRGSIRWTGVWMPIFKGYDEKFSPLVKRRLAHMAEKQEKMQANNDAAAIEFAGERLRKRDETRKIMIVFSDGQPADGGVSGACLQASTKYQVQRLEKEGVDVLGIGIQDSSVKHYYSKHHVINNVGDLPRFVLGQLKKLLT